MAACSQARCGRRRCRAERRVTGAAARRRHSTSTWPSSAPATPGCGRRYYLAAADPTLRVAVLEREHVGFGASGRNGGWCSALLADRADRARRPPRPRRGDRHAAGDARHRRRGRPRRSPARDRRRLRQGRHDLARPHRGAGARASPATSTRPARSASATTTSAGWTADEVGDALPGHRRARRRCSRRTARRSTRCGSSTPSPRPRCAAGVRIHEHTPRRGDRAAPGHDAARHGARRRRRAGHRGVHAPTLPGRRRDARPALLADGRHRAADARSSGTQIGLADRPTFHDARHLIIYGQRTADGRLAFGGRGAPYHFGSRIEPAFDTDERVRGDARRRRSRELFPVLADVDVPVPLGRPARRAPRLAAARCASTAPTGLAVGRRLRRRRRRHDQPRRPHARRPDHRPRTATSCGLPWVGHRSRRWEPEPLRWLGVNVGRLRRRPAPTPPRPRTGRAGAAGAAAALDAALLDAARPGTDADGVSRGTRSGTASAIQPGVEERRRGPAGDLLGEGDEVLGRPRRAVVVGDPALQQREEGLVADLAGAGRGARPRRRRSARSRTGCRRVGSPVGSVGVLARRRGCASASRSTVVNAGVVEPQPLGVRGERLVEPQVAPVGRA